MNTRFLKAIVILPGTALVYVPATLLWLFQDTAYAARFPPDSLILWLIAVVLGSQGLILMVWTTRLFAAAEGGGTPAPWDPINKLIVTGPYRHMRNPMLSGVILALGAEAALLTSVPIFVWMLVFLLVNTVYFSLSEEPQLEKRYGAAYRDYKNKVPRWMPRLDPYVGPSAE